MYPSRSRKMNRTRRDIEAKKAKENLKRVISPPAKDVRSAEKENASPSKSASPPKSVSPPKSASPPKRASPPKSASPPNSASPPKSASPSKSATPPKKIPPPLKADANPKDSPVFKALTSPPFKKESPVLKNEPLQLKTSSSTSVSEVSPILKKEHSLPTKKEIITSPPPFKLNRTDSKTETNNSIPLKVIKKDSIEVKETQVKTEQLSGAPSSSDNVKTIVENSDVENKNNDNAIKLEESNGVGDKIRKFEKAAEDASANVGKLSRPGSVRGRPRTERLGSDSKEEFPPPATPFKDNVFFELSGKNTPTDHGNHSTLERQHSITRSSVNLLKWQKSESNSMEGEKVIQKPEPQKIIKPEFKPMPSPVDVMIRSPSLGVKVPDQFPSQGTAFRNVAPLDTARASRDMHKINEDVNTENNFKTCKFKNKEKYAVSKGSSYFTRGSEEIWLVKKKDIEEIEERVLDSFRRAGGNLCGRSESMRPSSDSGQSASFSHATMGRNKRQMYARSESCDPQWAGTRAQTLKRQSSVACTCGHDKKTRAKSAGAEANPRPRSRSHGDENNQCHVLDKYETLV
ncbi:PREDICTED: serine/arginine repetitive matrix protein 1-like [Papilio xuthus]|uniref:Serine/arginine repetitive matrix protein 1-like n=1 Tax=Papilio xuthus TaxID=66420 RepID=A0AAJ6ZVB1_PAPXU|nr:PREDICTED: serine/arginine repetitive matrix protein 1-like [Papilio xuthus]